MPVAPGFAVEKTARGIIQHLGKNLVPKLRSGFADVLKGLTTDVEAEDMPVVTAQVVASERPRTLEDLVGSAPDPEQQDFDTPEVDLDRVLAGCKTIEDAAAAGKDYQDKYCREIEDFDRVATAVAKRQKEISRGAK